MLIGRVSYIMATNEKLLDAYALDEIFVFTLNGVHAFGILCRPGDRLGNFF